MANTNGKQELQEGLEVIESTNLKYFREEMTAEFFAMKGLFLAQLGKSEEANKSFSAAAQMHDTLVKAWALWGDYLEGIFVKEKWENRQMQLGVSALTCYLHACRHQNEAKSRKYLAKVLWLLSYDNNEASLADSVEKYNQGVPALSWLPWIPQLLTCLVRNEGKMIVNILSQIGRTYPQAVYFAIRTLYLTLKVEQREYLRKANLNNANANQTNSTNATTTTATTQSNVTTASSTPQSSTNTTTQSSIVQPTNNNLNNSNNNETTTTISATSVQNTSSVAQSQQQSTPPSTTNQIVTNQQQQTTENTTQLSIADNNSNNQTPQIVITTQSQQQQPQQMHANIINPHLQQRILMHQQQQQQQQQQQNSENPIKVTPPMEWRCSVLLFNYYLFIFIY